MLSCMLTTPSSLYDRSMDSPSSATAFPPSPEGLRGEPPYLLLELDRLLEREAERLRL